MKLIKKYFLILEFILIILPIIGLILSGLHFLMREISGTSSSYIDLFISYVYAFQLFLMQKFGVWGVRLIAFIYLLITLLPIVGIIIYHDRKQYILLHSLLIIITILHFIGFGPVLASFMI